MWIACGDKAQALPTQGKHSVQSSRTNIDHNSYYTENRASQNPVLEVSPKWAL